MRGGEGAGRLVTPSALARGHYPPGVPHLTPALSAPKGGEGAHAVWDSGPPPPIFGGTGEVGLPSNENDANLF